MKIAIIGSAGVPSKYGGFETLADQLVQNLSDSYQFTVYCSKGKYLKKPSRYMNADLVYIPLNANGWQSILYDTVSILKAYKKHDVLLILGVAGAFCLPFLKRFSKTKTIVHIDGMEWKREKWKLYAKTYLKYSESIALKKANKIIADNKAIFDSISSKYHKKTEIITYGGDHVSAVKLNQKLLSKLEISFDDYGFTVCRIVPENNIKTILDAFVGLDENFVIVGNWYDSDYGISLWQQYSEKPNIKLLNPIYNQSELDELRSNCKFYIHGHTAGGTNPSLVEAIALGLNIISYDINFNRETLNNLGYYFWDVDSLRKSIKEVSTFKDKKELLALAKREYTWNSISSMYSKLFDSLKTSH